MRIRLANLEDAEQMAQNNILLAKESEGASVDYSISLSAVKAVISDKNKGFYVVAEENNQVVGQLMVTFEWSDWRNGLIWWIQSVYIHPDYRRQGIYRQMYAFIKNLAKNENNVRGFRLYVEKENRIAQKTYESLGMRETVYKLYEELINIGKK